MIKDTKFILFWLRVDFYPIIYSHNCKIVTCFNRRGYIKGDLRPSKLLFDEMNPFDNFR